jgi:hypothetical protein
MTWPVQPPFTHVLVTMVIFRDLFRFFDLRSLTASLDLVSFRGCERDVSPSSNSTPLRRPAVRQQADTFGLGSS